jgi:hypothetical protein
VKQLEPGSGGLVFLIEHVKTKQQSVLKISYVDEKRKAEFEKQIDFWKNLNLKDEHIVILKENLYDNTNACLIFFLFFLLCFLFNFVFLFNLRYGYGIL